MVSRVRSLANWQRADKYGIENMWVEANLGNPVHPHIAMNEHRKAVVS